MHAWPKRPTGGQYTRYTTIQNTGAMHRISYNAGWRYTKLDAHKQIILQTGTVTRYARHGTDRKDETHTQLYRDVKLKTHTGVWFESHGDECSRPPFRRGNQHRFPGSCGTVEPMVLLHQASGFSDSAARGADERGHDHTDAHGGCDRIISVRPNAAGLYCSRNGGAVHGNNQGVAIRQRASPPSNGNQTDTERRLNFTRGCHRIRWNTGLGCRPTHSRRTDPARITDSVAHAVTLHPRRKKNPRRE